METTAEFTLAPPRIEQGEARLIAGLSQRYHNTNAGIPAQWQRFAPYIGHIPGQVGTATCGVICNTDDDGNTEYVCGVQVSTFSQARRELTRLRLAGRRYAVFFHGDHVSAISATWNAIMNQWAPDSGYRIADAPSLERYGESFDPRTGAGGLEIWVPLE